MWTALRYFNLYRLVIAGLFLLFGALGRLPPTFTRFNLELLIWVAGLYLATAIVLQIAIEHRRVPVHALRNVQVLADVAALTLFMHASGGAAGGFGILLVVAIAGACLLAKRHAAVGFAALATLAVLGETLYGSLKLEYPIASYTQAGLLGAALFATALLASVLAEQARRSEALAQARAVELEELHELNEYIVQRMRTGIVVLDAALRPLRVNEAAQRMLASGTDPGAPRSLDEGVRGAYFDWQNRGENRKTPLRLDSGSEVIVSFTHLGGTEGGNTLVFIEDAAEMQQRAQQIKLASLGRLTASIAHEVRNPLGAISHAAQLLSESPDLTADDAHLTQIILEHSARVNEIIENVMMIGRRDRAISESFPLRPWLEHFITELRERRELDETSVVCEWKDGDVLVRMDRTQLQQVLWNLCENALRYSTREPKLGFVCGVQAESGRPYVEIVDTGQGMSAEVAEQIFEPFFTGERGGTGLGLYIARELCEANQATLRLIEHGERGCRFRILFPHPHRQQLSAA